MASRQTTGPAPSSSSSLSRCAQARREANKITLTRLKKALDADSSTDLSVVLRNELAKYPGRVDRAVRKQVQSGRTLLSGRTNVTLPRCRGSEMVMICPISYDVLSYVLSRKPHKRTDLPPFPEILDEFFTILIDMVEWNPHVVHASATSLVFVVAPWLVLKVSQCMDADDIHNANYVAQCVPAMLVPPILGACCGAGRKWVFMPRTHGVTLESVWPALVHWQKQGVQQQLNSMFLELTQHVLNNQEQQRHLGSIAAGICKDVRHAPRVSSEAVLTEKEFNDFLCDVPGKRNNTWLLKIRTVLRDDHHTFLTHGELHPRNLMVTWDSLCPCCPPPPDANLVITGVMGWDKAGWYPEYWEFVKALSAIKHRPLSASGDWIDYLPFQGIGRYTLQYAIDSLLDECVV